MRIRLMFALARELPPADASTQAGKWEKNRFMGVELTSKEPRPDRRRQYRLDRRRPRARPAHEVIAVRSVPHAERCRSPSGVERVELDELLARADFITLTRRYRSDRNILVARGASPAPGGRADQSIARAAA
jgi:D-3-phosphoglycerate dehydrogenase